jgi:N utilization substance protein B
VNDAGLVESRWAGRRQARSAALQALYQCEIAGLSVPEAFAVLDAVGDPDAAVLTPADRAFAMALAAGAREGIADIDGRLGRAARHWRVERMGTIDRLILRMAVHEWLAHPETPPRVVINEAIELARTYSGGEAAKFVNGVLDGVLRALKEEGRLEEPRVE